MGLVWNHFEKLLMDESEAANDRSKRGSAFFSNSLLNRNFFEPEVGCFFFLLFNSKCWGHHITSHYFGFVGVCLVPPFLVSFWYFMGQRWNNNWQQALACQWYTNRLLEGCHSRRWEWVTITFSGRIKKSFKVFLLFSLRTYFIFNRLLNAVFQLVYYWSHLGAI